MTLRLGLGLGLTQARGGAAVPANALRASDGTPLRTTDGHYILVS